MFNRFFLQITLIPIFFIIITTVTISYQNVSELLSMKEEQIKKTTEDFFKHQKDEAKERVMFTVDSINFQKTRVRKLVKDRVKTRVDEAIFMANKYYDKYKDTYTEEVLKEQIKTIFSNMITKHKDGYFFSVDMSTEKIIIHKVPKLIGYSMTNHKDAKGVPVLGDQKELLKKSDGAFQTIYFTKPTQPDVQFPKQVYIRYFKPFNWLVGTGEYLDDMNKELQKFVLSRFGSFNKSKVDEYVFIHEIDYLHSTDKFAKVLLGKNINSNQLYEKNLEYKDDQDIVKKGIFEIIKNDREGYVTYLHSLKEGEPLDKKTAYFYYDKEWRWLVGSGFYYKNLEKDLEKLTNKVNEKIDAQIVADLIIMFLIVFLSGGAFFFIARKIIKTMKEGAKSLESQKKMFQTLYEKATTGVILFDANAKPFDCNGAILSMMKISKKDEFLSREFSYFSPLHQVDGSLSKTMIDKRINQCLDEGMCSFEWIHLDTSSNEFWVDVTLTRLELDDKTIIHALVQNINDKKILEQANERQQKVLIEQNKMAAMGEMIGNIAHQWRQPLSIIAGISNNMLLDIELEQSNKTILKDHVRSVINQTQKLSRTIEDFSEFFKPSEYPKKFNISFMFDRVFNIVNMELDENKIVVIKDIDEVAGQTYVDELLQVLVGLITNSKDVLSKNDEERYIFIEAKREEEMLKIVIKDNGGGIDEQIISRIKEPYFSTKHPSMGTGLGLFMTYTIVTKHMLGKFMIENSKYIYNDVGYTGAKVSILLPVLDVKED